MPDRRSGWRPVQDVELQGPPRLTAGCAEALSCSGRVERLTHGFHTYPAALHPDAAGILLDLVGGESVHDPFCGGGTVLVEGLVRGRRVYGSDLSSVALLVARGRTTLADAELLTRFRGAGRRITEQARHHAEAPHLPAYESIRTWYQPEVAMELEGLRLGIHHAAPEIQGLLRFCFSSILVKVSYRASDTSPRRMMVQRPAGTTAILFHKKVRELGRRLEELSAAVPAGTPPAEIVQGDARSARVPEPVDAVITSPPYPAVYDYLPLQQLRMVWLEIDQDPREAEMGARRAFKQDRRLAQRRWSEDLGTWLGTAASRLTPGGKVAVVIGDGHAGSRALDALSPLVERARLAGLEPLARASGARPDPGSGAPRREHVVLFRGRG